MAAGEDVVDERYDVPALPPPSEQEQETARARAGTTRAAPFSANSAVQQL